MMRRPKGLGRGLDALLGDSATVLDAPAGAPHTLPLSQLRPGRYQPRSKMDPDALLNPGKMKTYPVNPFAEAGALPST